LNEAERYWAHITAPYFKIVKRWLSMPKDKLMVIHD